MRKKLKKKGKEQNIKRQRGEGAWSEDANCVALPAGHETQAPAQLYVKLKMSANYDMKYERIWALSRPHKAPPKPPCKPHTKFY